MAQGNARTIALVAARTGSTRLPGKMLLPLGETTVLGMVLERLGNCANIDKIVLATTILPADDALEAIAMENGIACFRGSENDLVERLSKALETHMPEAGILVRVCADNPLLEPGLIDAAIRQLQDQNLDLITPFEFSSLPFGLSSVVMTRKTLEVINANAVNSEYREHVENYCFEHPDDFTIGYQTAPPELISSGLFTLDDAEDYARLQRLTNAKGDDSKTLTKLPLGRRLSCRGPGEFKDLVQTVAANANGQSKPKYDDASELEIEIRYQDDFAGYLTLKDQGGNWSALWHSGATTPYVLATHGCQSLSETLWRALDLCAYPPPRRAEAQPAPIPPASKTTGRYRRGYAHPDHALFPRRILIEQESSGLDARQKEIASRPWCQVLTGWDKAETDSPFADLLMAATGDLYIRPKTGGPVFLADATTPIVIAWMSPQANRIRQIFLNP